MLIVFPLGLLSTAVIFDFIYYASANPAFPVVSFWLIAAGIIGGLVAAVFGLIDWIAIPAKTRAKSIGLLHGIVNFVVVFLFAASWYLRTGASGEPSSLAVILSLLGFVLALVGGWLGGELVERLGIAVYSDANANAPSSLSSRPVVDVPAGRKSNVPAQPKKI
jgi:uncharacterized membrane protein